MAKKKNSASTDFPVPGSMHPRPEPVTVTPSTAVSDLPTQTVDVPGRNEAAKLIRSKIEALYSNEPDAEKELREALEPGKHSKHQQYLLDLHSSGKTAEVIQVEWHKYYEKLGNDEKFKVWQEFYSNQNRHTSGISAPEDKQDKHSPSAAQPVNPNMPKPKGPDAKITTEDLRDRIKNKVRAQSSKPSKKGKGRKPKLGFKHHLKSIGFGLLAGFIFLSIYMFTFFNERFIIPFVQPSTISASTQIITVPNAVVSPEPRVIIPKLNVEAPVVYDVPFIQPGEDESDFERRTQTALESGVVHYPTSQKPGQAGAGFNSNVVIVGHSSNNLFSRGSFKFAFMQIGKLEIGDTFIINKDSKQYVYRVYDNRVIAPTEVSILGAAARPNSATLITCDPPGFNVNRRVIIGEQISPDPATNVSIGAPAVTPLNTNAGVVPGNPQSLWAKLVDFIF